MATVTFKDLCADAADPALVARFWGAVLGLAVEVQPGGDAVLRRDGKAVLWVNRVPESKTVKNRVHVDLSVHADEALVALGATLVADQGEHRVLADPEGNEFCSFPGPPAATPATLIGLGTDSDRPEALAAWWAARIGGEVRPGPDGTPRWLRGGAGLGDVTWKFVQVDDERTVKNRWHWDVLGDVADLVAAGATVLREPDDDIGWTVLTDPDGNEFCAFPVPTDP